MDTKNALRWYDLDYIVYGAKASGHHVREDWRLDDGAYGGNLPEEIVAEIEKVDWRRCTPSEALADLAL